MVNFQSLPPLFLFVYFIALSLSLSLSLLLLFVLCDLFLLGFLPCVLNFELGVTLVVCF